MEKNGSPPENPRLRLRDTKERQRELISGKGRPVAGTVAFSKKCEDHSLLGEVDCDLEKMGAAR